MENDTRWAHIAPNDRSGTLYIVTFLGFTYSSLTFLARVWIKWHMLGLDDLAMLLAQIACIIQFAIVLASLSAGLARSFETLTEQQYSRMAVTFAGAQVATYVSLGFSKMASILLVRRLFIRDMKNAWIICNIITGVVTIWTLVAAPLVSAGCTNESLSPKTPQDICTGIETRYLFVVVTDGITDFVLAFVPTYLCRHLQMNMYFKLQVLGIFALRLPLLALAGLFYRTWTSSLQSDDPGVSRTLALVYLQTELCCSLIAATIPCLKSFIQSFDTGSGQKAGFGYSSNSGAYGHMSSVHHSTGLEGNGESYQMSRLDHSQNSASDFGHREDTKSAIRVNRKSPTPDESSATDDGGGDMERRSTQESDRKSHHSTQELVIRKDVQFDVKREPAKKGSSIHQPGLLRLPK
ncbi:hypothetical protein C7974DRAFT_421421 [Boeremia exigua]|uniref:uncharacterized protein n=1 Tax=Boeremia exigua TaxID=749465 RepID=UPI001E8D7747|nr:uncharacterized protein C7974DRAFT_421421 [Boeremia exigua]KAH6638746.1 hypothetical protein C7974DRAFT_421421 [Boeremia exigua]